MLENPFFTNKTTTFAKNIYKTFLPMKKFTSLFAMLLIFAATLSAQNYPFTLTQPGEEPVLYFIYSGRDGNGGIGDYVFSNTRAYNASNDGLGLSRKDPRNFLEQLWYFMEAEDGNIMIISAYDNTLISVANTTDSPKSVKLWSKEDAAGKYYTWILDNTNGCYAFKTSNGKTFLSHNGNWSTAGQYMGLYKENGSKDEGSRVFFEAAPEGIETGIKTVNVNNTQTATGIFTITGQKIESITHPGIYIVDGKKILVK